MSKTKKIFIVFLVNFIRCLGYLKRGLIAASLILKGPLSLVDDFLFHIIILPLYRIYRFLKLVIFGESRFRRHIWGKWGISVTLTLLFVFGLASTLEASPSYISDAEGQTLIFTLMGGGESEVVQEIAEGGEKGVLSYLQGEAVLEGAQGDSIPVDYIPTEDMSLTTFGGVALIQPMTFVTDASVAPRIEVEIYVVGTGDTISSIARKFGLNINTLLWANNLSARSVIRPGNKLKILPVDGVLYKIKKGDTVSKIAKALRADEKKITEFNKLSSVSALEAGSQIIVPGGTNPQPVYQAPAAVVFFPPAAKNNFGLIWPAATKRITQYYSWRHPGLDVGGGSGVPIYAVDGGIIEYAGWGTGYGWEIVINHGNGMKTRYAHSRKLLAKKGDQVAQGQIIMEMGSTGWSTGPHLHFEIYINGRRVNPLSYVR